MMATDQNSARKGRGWKWLLGLSLALNLIFLGFVAGAAWRFAGPSGHAHKWRDQAAAYGAPFVRALPKEARRELQRELRRSAGQTMSRADRRALYVEMVGVLRQDPFDGTAVEAIFATQAGAAQEIQARAQESWLKIVSEMTPAEREQVAAGLEELLTRGAKKDKQKP